MDFAKVFLVVVTLLTGQCVYIFWNSHISANDIRRLAAAFSCCVQLEHLHLRFYSPNFVLWSKPDSRRFLRLLCATFCLWPGFGLIPDSSQIVCYIVRHKSLTTRCWIYWNVSLFRRSFEHTNKTSLISALQMQTSMLNINSKYRWWTSMANISSKTSIADEWLIASHCGPTSLRNDLLHCKRLNVDSRCFSLDLFFIMDFRLLAIVGHSHTSMTTVWL